jgi:hypothetical protein
MSSTAFIGLGTTIGFSTTQGGSYTNLAEVYDLKGPGLSVTDVDITNNNSPSYFKEFIPGLIDAGKVSGKLIFTSGGLSTLFALIGQTSYYWRVTFPEGSIFAFYGFLCKLEMDEKTGDKIEADFEIKLTGNVQYTA